MSLRTAILVLTLIAVGLAHATANGSREVGLRGFLAYAISLAVSLILAHTTTTSREGFFQKFKELALYFTLLAICGQFGCQMRFSEHDDKILGIVLAILASLFLSPAFFACIQSVEKSSNQRSGK
jgi:hypothetical protein